MFRQEEVFVGGWIDKTIDVMQKRRFDLVVRQLPQLGADRLEALAPSAFKRRIEHCWQEIECKPMRSQQINQIWKSVLSDIELQADCLSHEEHELVERALILGGSVQIEDLQELQAAKALSLRLWASVGLVSGKPYVELETPVIHPVAKAFAREAHERIRRRMQVFGAYLNEVLYQAGAIDDRQPQQLLIREVLSGFGSEEAILQLSRRYLWAGYDCVDYSDGVMLLHPALAEPGHLLACGRRKNSFLAFPQENLRIQMDILPEEIPIQKNLERTIAGALRAGFRESDVARNLRYLCKQGAPLSALEEVLQASLMICITDAMRGALCLMYYRIPKWMECEEYIAMQ